VPEIAQNLIGVYKKPVENYSGSDFPIGLVTSAQKPGSEATIPKTPTHVLIRQAMVKELPAQDAAGELQLWPGTQVSVVKSSGFWALVAREGQTVGYVPADALARLEVDNSEKGIKVGQDVMGGRICEETRREYESLNCESQQQCSTTCRKLGARLQDCASNRHVRCAQ
jgi:hypothetical protein